MSVMMVIQIAIIAAVIVLVTVFSVLGKLKKFSRMATTLSLFIVALVGSSALLVTFFLEKPSFDVLGDTEIILPVFAEYEEPGAAAYFRNKDISDKINVTGDVNTSVVGEYNVEYNFSMRGSYYYAVRRVIVRDETAPEIQLSGEKKLKLSSLKHYEEAGFTARDNYDGDISDSVKVTTQKIADGKFKISYTATDSSGNSTTVFRELDVKDTVKPILNLESELFVNLPKNSDFSYPKATASDDVDGDISSDIKCNGTVDTSKEGVYTVTYTISDSSDNTVTKTVQFNVFTPFSKELSTIYLTFDDGPSSNVTPIVLDILKKNNIKATFFINDYSEDKQPLVQRIISEGHTLAVHGTTHDYAAAYKNLNACINNFTTLSDKIQSSFGYKVSILRFPGGSSNMVSKKYCKGVVTSAVKKLTADGWRYFDWNVDSGDADGNMSKDYIVGKVKAQLKKGRANVVLMHDYHTKSTTADALQEIIDYGKANGYAFSAINETTPDAHHNIAN